MATLCYVTFIYSLYLYSCGLSGAVPVIDSNKQNIIKRFDGFQQKNNRMETLGNTHKLHEQNVYKSEEDQFKIIPTYILDLYNIVSKQANSDLMNHGDTVRSYFDSESEASERTHHQYKFKVNDIKNNEEDLKKAELRVFKLSSVKQRSLNSFVQINIINIQDGRIVSSKLMGIKTHGWLSFPLTDIAKHWIQNPESNQGIRIVIKTIYGNGDVIDFATKNHIRREPMLVVFTKHKEGSSTGSLLNLNLDTTLLNTVVEKKLRVRKRRSKRNTQKCRLAPLKVPLKEIGWENRFVSPKVLEINQCIGRCPVKMDKHTGQTNHALIQAMYASITKQVNYPCCAPASFAPETAILTDYSTGVEFIKIAQLDKLRVTSCQCL